MSDDRSQLRRWGALALAAALAAGGVTALLINVFQRKQEARNPFFRVAELTEKTEDPEEWGKNFPHQYDGYRRTVDMVRTKYGGSEALPRAPTPADPRAVVSQSRLAEDPRLVRMWRGYAFSKDFREERGHAYMLEDQTFTGRQQAAPQPGACMNCHASMAAVYKALGDGDAVKGFERVNAMPYQEARAFAKHPVSCVDCHDPRTMELRVTRPAFVEGLRALAASPDPVPHLPSVARWRAGNRREPYDPNRMATRQEMRTFACAQCHVEYYFKGKEKRLTYPWHNGLKVDDIVKYYAEVGHKDWTHADTGADALKAQHPEFEMFSQGVHARAGVACADCHMPYMREGAMKISDHHVRSPLLNINRACQTCHRAPEAELKARVETIQARTHGLRDSAMDALMDLIDDLEAAQAAGTPDATLAAARTFQREAQFRLDFVEAENSTGFHAPQEAARILADSINLVRKGQMALRERRKGRER